MRTIDEIYDTVVANNKKSLSKREIAIRCMRVVGEDIIIAAAGYAHPHRKPEWIRKKILTLVDEIL